VALRHDDSTTNIVVELLLISGPQTCLSDQLSAVCDQVQFVAGVTHAAQSIYVGCPFPLWMQWALIIYAGSVFALFINFYFQSYIRPTRSAAQVTAITVKPLSAK